MKRGPVLLPDEEGAGRVLPWVIAVMALLGTLISAGGIALTQTVAAWHADVAGTLTVEVPVPDAGDMDRRATAALDVLRTTAGIRSAALVPQAEVAALLEPWLGDSAAIADLPVPRLIDVRLDAAQPPDLELLAQRLDEAAPGARVDDHALWMDQLTRLAHAAQWIAVGTVGLIGLATAAVVVFATRAAFSAHHDIVEVLHLIGARDGFIAGHFQRQALSLGLRGGLLGGLLGVAIVLLLAYLARDLQMPLLPRPRIDLAQLALIALLPVATGLIAMVTARVTVLRALARLP